MSNQDQAVSAANGSDSTVNFEERNNVLDDSKALELESQVQGEVQKFEPGGSSELIEYIYNWLDKLDPEPDDVQSIVDDQQIDCTAVLKNTTWRPAKPKCQFCGRTCSRRSALIAHEKKCPSPGSLSHQCKSYGCLDRSKCPGRMRPQDYRPPPDRRYNNN